MTPIDWDNVHRVTSLGQPATLAIMAYFLCAILDKLRAGRAKPIPVRDDWRDVG